MSFVAAQDEQSASILFFSFLTIAIQKYIEVYYWNNNNTKLPPRSLLLLVVSNVCDAVATADVNADDVLVVVATVDVLVAVVDFVGSLEASNSSRQYSTWFCQSARSVALRNCCRCIRRIRCSVVSSKSRNESCNMARETPFCGVDEVFCCEFLRPKTRKETYFSFRIPNGFFCKEQQRIAIKVS